MTKVCKQCGLSKPLTSFYINIACSMGRASKCKDCERIGRLKYYNKNKEHLLNLSREYFKENRLDYYKKRNIYCRKKRANDPHFKIANNIRRRMLYALKGGTKYKKSFDLIGCSSQELKYYLESKFLPGMSWDNYGYYGWVIDHIIPCSFFILSDYQEQKFCFHYTNLQPLWAKDNFRKSDSIITSNIL